MSFSHLIAQIYQTQGLTVEQNRRLAVMVQQGLCSTEQLGIVDQLIEDIIVGIILQHEPQTCYGDDLTSPALAA